MKEILMYTFGFYLLLIIFGIWHGNIKMIRYIECSPVPVMDSMKSAQLSYGEVQFMPMQSSAINKIEISDYNGWNIFEASTTDNWQSFNYSFYGEKPKEGSPINREIHAYVIP